jgi:hypothetical protein
MSPRRAGHLIKASCPSGFIPRDHIGGGTHSFGVTQSHLIYQYTATSIVLCLGNNRK